MNPAHQPLVAQCRYAQTVAGRHGFEFELLDPDGYLFRVATGGASALIGAGPVSSYPLNSATAASIAHDKIFTNRVLDRHGIAHLGGRCFALTADGKNLRGSGHELADAIAYARQLGFPVFCKPISGSRGDFAEVIADEAAFEDFTHRASVRHRTVVVQPVFEGSELRVFVFDGEPLFCVEKLPVTLTGDGVRTVAELLFQRNSELTASGISSYPPGVVISGASRIPRPASAILTEVPADGERLELGGRRNLAVGAGVTPLDPVPDDAAAIAVEAVAAIGLRIGAVDLLRPAGLRHHVIEINANPDIVTLERLGRWDLIEHIWLRIFRALLR